MPAPVVVITGASAGVGRATALRFARRGARVALLARGRAGLEAARRDVEREGGEALALTVDVARASQVESAAERVMAEWGRLDIWVNNAMASVFSPVGQMTALDYRRVTEVTYLGTVHGTLAALRRMRVVDRGVIVQVGSALAYRGIPLQSAYCAAKHAVQGFCESLRAELLHDGSRVRVVMVQLPALNTPQFGWVKSRLRRRAQPVPPIFQPEVAADAIVWASGHERAEVSLGWPTVRATLANALAPGLVDRFLARYGFESQQTQQLEKPDRPHNLWIPVDDDHDAGAHGSFDARAKRWSWQFALSRRRRLIGGACAVAGTAAAMTLLHERAR
jgi:NAD(P)-dependent dehydrogenase (short-subunit alcohol dehydrogenase family)